MKGLSFEKILTASAYGYQIVRHPFRRSTVSKRFAVVERLLQRDALCVYTPSGFRFDLLKGMCFYSVATAKKRGKPRAAMFRSGEGEGSMLLGGMLIAVGGRARDCMKGRELAARAIYS